MIAKKEIKNEEKSNQDNEIIISVGEIFVTARENKGFSLDDIVKELNIRKSYISAIESNEFDKLPDGIYKKAYIKSYAEILDIDSEPLLKKIYGENADNDNEKNINENNYSGNSVPGKNIILFSILLATIIYGGWYFLNNYNGGKGINFADLLKGKSTVISNKDKDNNIVKSKNAEIDHIEKVLSSYAEENPRIGILAINDANLEILGSNGEVLISKEMQAGEVYFVPKVENNVKFKSDISSFELFADGNFVDSVDSLEKTEDGIVLNNKQLLSLSSIE